ncbi:hypothetical protein [Azohydromonas aeria]|uniref:hypothetical protein n=1 Tax=Azohydromonas aeria TaxID=2590212 RepID=UPI0012F779C9|nr:hypothetical protein [Azohydromonas aeria]
MTPFEMKRAAVAGAAALAALVLAGCAGVPRAPAMGAAPDAKEPPRLVATDKKDPQTGKLLLDWDRPGAFGAVSGDLKAVGDGACMAARVDLEALGYHPRALDEKGQAIPGGGFYCYPRANGEKWDATAPQLVPSKGERGLLAWDRPGAFGKVPAQLQVRGDVACMLADVKLEAIAYHPQARGPDGAVLPGGGFYCFPKRHGEQPGEVAPRLVRQDGQLAWDRPAAFGKVPEGLRQRGNAVCGKGQEAIGYHPKALNDQGQPIPGGGFFCAAARPKDGERRQA